jgi:ribonucleotide monophosphatase NagD (HAD superfamily)
VVVGEKDYDWHQVIAAVFNFLIEHPAAPLIVPNPDVAYPGRHNRLHPASGAVARFLQLLCREFDHPLEPVYLGKPFAPIFRWNHRLLEHRAGRPVRHDRVLMVGDFLASDIRGGRDFGYRTALVLTGITTIELLHRSEIQPELVFMRL